MTAGFKSMRTDMTTGFNAVNVRFNNVDKKIEDTQKEVLQLHRGIKRDFEVLCASWIKSWIADNHEIVIPANSFLFRYNFPATDRIINPALPAKK